MLFSSKQHFSLRSSLGLLIASVIDLWGCFTNYFHDAKNYDHCSLSNFGQNKAKW